MGTWKIHWENLNQSPSCQSFLQCWDEGLENAHIVTSFHKEVLQSSSIKWLKLTVHRLVLARETGTLLFLYCVTIHSHTAKMIHRAPKSGQTLNNTDVCHTLLDFCWEEKHRAIRKASLIQCKPDVSLNVESHSSCLRQHREIPSVLYIKSSLSLLLWWVIWTLHVN